MGVLLHLTLDHHPSTETDSERHRILETLSGAELEMWEAQGGPMNDRRRKRLRAWYLDEGERSALRAERRREERIAARMKQQREKERIQKLKSDARYREKRRRAMAAV